MPARLMTVATIAAAMSGAAFAQSAGIAGTSGETSARQAASGTAYAFSSPPELLGGPVRQPGEIRIASERTNDRSGSQYAAQSATRRWAASSGGTETDTVSYGEPRVVLTEAYRASQQTSEDYVRPGTQVQSSSGTPLGRVELVEKGPSGVVSTAWVRPPNSNLADLKEVQIRSVTYANGAFVAVAG